MGWVEIDTVCSWQHQEVHNHLIRKKIMPATPPELIFNTVFVSALEIEFRYIWTRTSLWTGRGKNSLLGAYGGNHRSMYHFDKDEGWTVQRNRERILQTLMMVICLISFQNSYGLRVISRAPWAQSVNNKYLFFSSRFLCRQNLLLLKNEYIVVRIWVDFEHE